MAKPKYPKEFLELCASVTGKRPKTVIDHILKHGHITTEELKNKYGYDHPPRAARDVRELGIQLETFRVEAANGRKIAAYRFSDPTKKQFRRFSGRTGLSKEIKDQLIAKYGCQCFIYLEKMDAANLQIDHRVPYEVAGEADELKTEDFMRCAVLRIVQNLGRVNIARIGKARRIKPFACRAIGRSRKNTIMWRSAKSGGLISFGRVKKSRNMTN